MFLTGDASQGLKKGWTHLSVWDDDDATRATIGTKSCLDRERR